MAPPDKTSASVSAGWPCPGDDKLRRLIEARGPVSDAAPLVDHVGQCAVCQRRLESFAASRKLWSKAAENLRESTADEDAGLTSLIHRLQTRILGADETATLRLPDPASNFLRPCSTPERMGCLGPYEVIEVLGRGGMGLVYKAFDPALARTVAIKVLASPPAFSAGARARFRREARAAAAVKSQFVVVIHAVEEAAEPPYLVMEYIEGASLQEHLDRSGPLEITEIVRIGAEIARGLAAAHAQGLIHRDVKPANILLEAGTGRVKITDFGLARAVDDPTLTQAGTVTGTPEYMAPEQTGDGPIDHRVDLFSLGSVLYAMCTGRTPFRADRSLAVLRRMREESPPAIGPLRPETPRALIEIIERLHRKDPQARYATALEVAEALEALAARLADPQRADGCRPTTAEDDSMASRWFYKVFDQEMGPVSFQDLVDLARAGTLTEEDRVRRELSEEWIAAREVIGLFRAAQGPGAQAKPGEASKGPGRPAAEPASPQIHVATALAEPDSAVRVAASPAASPRRRWRLPRIGLTTWIVAGLVLIVAAIVVYEVRSHSRSRIFPESLTKRPRPPDPQLVEAIRAPRPKVPSIPGLEEGIARRIPGLETIDPGFSPTLTADMKTIVFAAASPDFLTKYDLYIATRDDVSKPFSAPKLIGSCRTREAEAFPTLSPDGLELVFVRSDFVRTDLHPQLYHAMRDSASAEFGEPVLVKVPDYDAFKKEEDKRQQVFRPQFLDPLHLMFGFQLDPKVRKMVALERPQPKSSFGRLQDLPFTAPEGWRPWSNMSVNGLRAYCGGEDGLLVAARASASATFGEAVKLVDVKTTGPFDGPVWVAPQEDVVFYTSPGPGEKPGLRPGDKGRKLWMLRF